MAISSRPELIEALLVDPTRILGTPESDWLDFKTGPYDLDTNKGKWELAKDVAAFANYKGGYIVVGIEAVRHANALTETAETIRPVTKGVVDLDRYRKLIANWCYPSVQGLNFAWYPADAAIDTGLLLIEVPAQDDGDRYFILKKMIDEQTARETGAFGIPVRNGDLTEWLPAERIHHLINTGRHPSHGTSAAVPQPNADLEGRAAERARQLEELSGWDEIPVFSLQALPPPGRPDQLPLLYGEVGLAQTLARPLSLRPSGFGWRTGVEPEVMEGRLLYRARERALLIDPDGLLTAATTVAPDTLGWAINDRSPGPIIRINSITLVEMTLEFFRLVHAELIARLEPLMPQVAPTWNFTVRCTRFMSGQVQLAPGMTQRGFSFEEPRPASSDEWIRKFETTGDASRDAFEALTKVYGLFALGEDAIPFSADRRIVGDQILALT